MRIVYYVVGWPPDRFPNGVVSATACLAPALERAGHEVRILAHHGEAAAGTDAISYVNGVRTNSLPRKLKNALSRDWELYVGAAEDMARHINRTPELKGADIVEMEESFGWSGVIAGRIDAPVITRLHGPWFINSAAEHGAARFTRADDARIDREKAGILASAGVSSPSRYVLDAVRERYDLPLAGAAVIPNAVAPVPDDLAWKADRADPDEILFVGRFDRHKGGDTILLAFAELARTRPRLKLTFAGPNQKNIRAGRRTLSLREFVDSSMPEDAARRINFLGPVPFSSLGELRRRAFVTVIASRIEIFPGVVAEALAHGSPTVATNVGGIPEMIRDGVDGLLAPPETPFPLAAAIASLLDNPALAARLGETGRRRVRSLYSPEGVAKLSLAYYEEVAARRRKGGPS